MSLVCARAVSASVTPVASINPRLAIFHHVIVRISVLRLRARSRLFGPFCRGSFRLDAGKLERLGPFVDSPRDHACKLGGRASSRRVADLGKSRLQVRIGEAGIDLSVELVDDLGGDIPGNTNSVPAARLVAG